MNLPVTNTVDVINGEPIETVDYLGISLLNLNSSAPAHIPPGGTNANTSYIAPAIRQGQERIADGTLRGQHPARERRGRSRRRRSGGGADRASGSGTRTFRAAGRGPEPRAARAKVGTRITYALSRRRPGHLHGRSAARAGAR